MRHFTPSNQNTACLSQVTNTPHPSREVKTLLGSVHITLECWRERWSARRRLRLRLYRVDTDALEKDAGLPAGTLQREARKPFWQK